MGTKKEELNPIDTAFERASAEYEKYRDAKVKSFMDQGIEVDVISHETHWQKVFLMGKIQMMNEKLEAMGDKKDDTRETTVKKTTKRKPASRKKSKRNGRGQLSLGVQR